MDSTLLCIKIIYLILESINSCLSYSDSFSHMFLNVFDSILCFFQLLLSTKLFIANVMKIIGVSRKVSRFRITRLNWLSGSYALNIMNTHHISWMVPNSKSWSRFSLYFFLYAFWESLFSSNFLLLELGDDVKFAISRSCVLVHFYSNSIAFLWIRSKWLLTKISHSKSKRLLHVGYLILIVTSNTSVKSFWLFLNTCCVWSKFQLRFKFKFILGFWHRIGKL